MPCRFNLFCRRLLLLCHLNIVFHLLAGGIVVVVWYTSPTSTHKQHPQWNINAGTCIVNRWVCWWCKIFAFKIFNSFLYEIAGIVQTSWGKCSLGSQYQFYFLVRKIKEPAKYCISIYLFSNSRFIKVNKLGCVSSLKRLNICISSFINCWRLKKKITNLSPN